MQKILLFAGICSLAIACSSKHEDAAQTEDASPTNTDDVGADTDAAETVEDTADTGSPNSAELTALSIEGLTMSPAFSPEIHDYAVRCNAGVNSLGVRAAAKSGVSVVMKQPTTTELGAEAASVDVAEDGAIVVETDNGAGLSESYWIRCLPHDFPPMKIDRPGSPSSGWYLLSNVTAVAPSSSFAMVLDNRGTPVWYRRDSARPTYVSAPSKNVLAWSPALNGTDLTGHFSLVQLESGATTTVTAVSAPIDHHEFLMLPSGNAMVLAYPTRTGFDLSSRGVSATRIGDCTIQEIAPDGSLVWEWSASDHFDVASESTFLPVSSDIADVFHCNSIDVGPTGDLLVSARHLDAVFLIERSTGKVIWKLGGTGDNKDGAQQLAIVDAKVTDIHRQHDARFLSDGSISLFDDHGPATDPARGLELTLDRDSGTARIVWEYNGIGPVAAMGSMRHLEDGARLIGWGTQAVPAVTEVDTSGKVSFEISFPLGDVAYRATKVPSDRLDINILRNTAGGGT